MTTSSQPIATDAAPLARVLGSVLAIAFFTACAASGSGASGARAPATATAGSPAGAVAPGTAAEDAVLDRVAAIHGAPGPWAVAGYRMGQYAIAKLGLAPGSFDIEVEHHSPRQVMYSCIADGVAAASGASVGKLNLSFVEADMTGLETVYRNRSTGQTITLRPTASFRARFANTPRERARDFGREVLRLAPNEIFEEVPSKR